MPNPKVQDISRADALQAHFSHRISNHVRALVNHFRQLGKADMSAGDIKELVFICEKLMTHAQHFNQPNQLALATQLRLHLRHLQHQQEHVSDTQSQLLKGIVFQLGQSDLRETDTLDSPPDSISKSPILLALESSFANTLTEQLELFSIDCFLAKNHNDFLYLHQQYPDSRCIMDIDFQGKKQGLQLAKGLPKDKTSGIIFISENHIGLTQHLEAIRCGGEALFIQPSIAQLIQALDQQQKKSQTSEYKVLIIDDSKTQAALTSKILQSENIQTLCIHDPTTTLEIMMHFQPDLILMDMYMPECSGSELASIIRQHANYVSTPILFLSGEENKAIQLGAMAQGGDDFLTKPVDPKHLISTIKNRGDRAKVLKDLITRDSLTHLYNHTHILDKLNQHMMAAKKTKQPLCFAMIDIDLFKAINDKHGHPTGDKVICALSLFLNQRLRQTDEIGRYGGEEFALILTNTNKEQAKKIINEIRLSFSKLVHPSAKGEFQVSFSCGICQLDHENQQSLLKNADEALYSAKEAGRNQVVLHEY